MAFNIFQKDGRYYVKDDANIVEKATAGMANFGVNAQDDANNIAQGMAQAPQAFAKAGERPVIGSAELLAEMVKGYGKGMFDLIANPSKTVYEKPVSTFFNMLPFASKVMSSTPKVNYAAKSKASVEQLKGGANKTYDAQKGMLADLNAYQDMLKNPVQNKFLLDAMADKYGNNPAFGSLFKQHQPQTAGIGQLISHEGAPDRARVDFYKQKIANGERIDPLIVVKEGKKWGIEDGKHRYQAFIESGYNTVPVIVRPGARSVLRKPNGQFNGSIRTKMDNYMYHGTAPKNLESIKKNGLIRGTFSDKLDTPIEYGRADSFSGRNSSALIRVKSEVLDYKFPKSSMAKDNLAESTKNIPPDKLEVSLDSGKTWQPLVKK